jgi:hypothetical protein
MFEGGRVELNGNVHVSSILPAAIAVNCLSLFPLPYSLLPTPYLTE